MCGASKTEKQVNSEQVANFQDLSNNAQQVFGASSQIFQDLVSSFAPVVAAGPGQAGYTAPEMAALKSQAITESGQAYRSAAQAAGERIAAAGGGNAVLPSGVAVQTAADIAAAGAGRTAGELQDINLRSAELGRENWLRAAGVLGGAPGVFAPSTSAAGVATGAGSSAMGGAQTIQQAQNQWVGDVMGVLGDTATIASKFV